MNSVISLFETLNPKTLKPLNPKPGHTVPLFETPKKLQAYGRLLEIFLQGGHQGDNVGT